VAKANKTLKLSLKDNVPLITLGSLAISGANIQIISEKHVNKSEKVHNNNLF
jgi:hypothetical protein